jgi:hypothetical protein
MLCTLTPQNTVLLDNLTEPTYLKTLITFMKPKSLLPCPQQSDSGSCFVSDESNSHLRALFLQASF